LKISENSVLENELNKILVNKSLFKIYLKKFDFNQKNIMYEKTKI